MLQAAGGAVARSRSKTELQSLLTQLHHDITTQVCGGMLDICLELTAHGGW